MLTVAMKSKWTSASGIKERFKKTIDSEDEHQKSHLPHGRQSHYGHVHRRHRYRQYLSLDILESDKVQSMTSAAASTYNTTRSLTKSLWRIMKDATIMCTEVTVLATAHAYTALSGGSSGGGSGGGGGNSSSGINSNAQTSSLERIGQEDEEQELEQEQIPISKLQRRKPKSGGKKNRKINRAQLRNNHPNVSFATNTQCTPSMSSLLLKQEQQEQQHGYQKPLLQTRRNHTMTTSNILSRYPSPLPIQSDISYDLDVDSLTISSRSSTISEVELSQVHIECRLEDNNLFSRHCRRCQVGIRDKNMDKNMDKIRNRNRNRNRCKGSGRCRGIEKKCKFPVKGFENINLLELGILCLAMIMLFIIIKMK